MKSFVVSALVLCGLVSAAPVLAAEHPAVIFINNMGEQALELGEIRSDSDRHAAFCRLVKRNVSTSHVLPEILGEFYSDASSSQLEEISDYIMDLLVKHLNEAFQQSAGGSFRVSSRAIESNPVGVNAELFDARGVSRFKFLFFVKNNNKVVDARIKNILISRFLKNDYQRYMRQHRVQPIQSLIGHLAGQNPACP